MLRRILNVTLCAVFIATAIACSGGDDDETPPVDVTPAASAGAAAEASPADGGGTGPPPRIRPQDGLTTVEIADQLAPSIVRVQTEAASIDIFGRVVPSEGVGTGVVIDGQGHIVTNNHVVTRGDGSQPADQITVTLSDQRSMPATIVGRDQATDLAVLKIDVTDVPSVPFADPESLQVGQEVVAIGFALGLEGAPTVTRGVISATHRTIEEQPFTIPDAIQTDAGINPGNSGGPLVNAFGEIVGINTAIIRGAQNIGFAIAVGLVEPTVRQLIESGSIERAFFGVGTVDVTESIAQTFGLPVSSGIAVTAIGAGSPAAAAGLQQDDVIVAVDGEPIANNGELLAILARHQPGDVLSVEYYRGPERQTASVTLSARPD